jgi:hypothetical protein
MIADAKTKLAVCKIHQMRLRAAIRVFEQNIAAGLTFPTCHVSFNGKVIAAGKVRRYKRPRKVKVCKP